MTASGDSSLFPSIVRKSLMIGVTGIVATFVYAVLFVSLSPAMNSMCAHVVAYLTAVGVQFFILTFRVFVGKGKTLVHANRARRYAIQILVILMISTVAEHMIDLPPIMKAGVLLVVITCINMIMYFVWTFRT
jgi:putative flippase GtrA